LNQLCPARQVKSSSKRHKFVTGVSLVLGSGIWLTEGVTARAVKAESEPISEKDLGHWKMMQVFRQRLETVFGEPASGSSWADPKRQLGAVDYLSLFLFGLLNPVTQTLRGISAASLLPRVQQEVCSRAVPRASFSDAQHILDAALLEKVLLELSEQIPREPTDDRLGQWQWLARDGSLFRALPRMAWALYGAGRVGQSRAVRLHLSLHVVEDRPVQMAVRPGGVCERAVWEEQLEKGAAYIGDRLYGQNFRLLAKLKLKGCAYILRLREQTRVNLEEELAVSAEDRAAGVERQAWVRLGGGGRYQSVRVRLVWIPTREETLLLVTNLAPAQLPAELVSVLYRKRWKVELFFRWVKCILGCGHWLAESPNGATLQIYLALIASLLLQLHIGRRPNKRMMELVRFYLLGWASPDELQAGLERHRRELEKRKKI
jgi:hypothetical protein